MSPSQPPFFFIGAVCPTACTPQAAPRGSTRMTALFIPLKASPALPARRLDSTSTQVSPAAAKAKRQNHDVIQTSALKAEVLKKMADVLKNFRSKTSAAELARLNPSYVKQSATGVTLPPMEAFKLLDLVYADKKGKDKKRRSSRFPSAHRRWTSNESEGSPVSRGSVSVRSRSVMSSSSSSATVGEAEAEHQGLIGQLMTVLQLMAHDDANVVIGDKEEAAAVHITPSGDSPTAAFLETLMHRRSVTEIFSLEGISVPALGKAVSLEEELDRLTAEGSAFRLVFEELVGTFERREEPPESKTAEEETPARDPMALYDEVYLPMCQTLRVVPLYPPPHFAEHFRLEGGPLPGDTTQCAALAKTVHPSSGLRPRVVELVGNWLPDDGLAKIVGSAVESQRLETLGIEGSYVGMRTVEAVTNALRRLKTLRHIALRSCGLGGELRKGRWSRKRVC